MEIPSDDGAACEGAAYEGAASDRVLRAAGLEIPVTRS
jgi:hypothetical protein